MSQSYEYSNFPCRWNWCRNTFSNVVDLLEHVRDHVNQTEPCLVKDIPLLIRAEDGVGESLSGITGFDSNNSMGTQNPNSMPESVPLPVVDFSLLPQTPSRSTKRRKITSQRNSPFLTRFPSTSAPTPPRTPGFAALAQPHGSAQLIPNPDFPEFDALVSKTLAGGAPASRVMATPVANRSVLPPSQTSSDGSVERQLTQSFDTSFDGAHASSSQVHRASASQNPYAGELNWDDQPVPSLPRSRSQTPSQSQSQQQGSYSSLMGAFGTPSREMPLQRRQSWYQASRRVSDPRQTPSAVQQTPLFAGSPSQNVLNSNSSPSPPKPQTPTATPMKTYLSGSLTISGQELHSHPYGDAINPRTLHPPQYAGFGSQYPSQGSPSSFVFQTQAPYRSQSISQ
ncbi:hypothetical protein R3P38DRAFT_2832236, partial [Favolaschia claudopus]